MIKKEDLIFLLSPFLLTAVFLVIGYQILIQSTPEARINPEMDENTIVILENGDIDPVGTEVLIPSNIEGPIVPIPSNQDVLDKYINDAIEQQANTLVVSIPIQMIDDVTFVLSDIEGNNEENMRRWLKKTINQANQNNMHVMLSFSINASQTISQPQLFAQEYSKFIKGWMLLAQEFAVSFVSPGITANHPLYSQIELADQQKVINTVRVNIAKDYNGQVGIGYCCGTDLELELTGYRYVTLINTPEFPFVDMKPVVTAIENFDNPTNVYFLNRDKGLITSEQP